MRHLGDLGSPGAYLGCAVCALRGDTHFKAKYAAWRSHFTSELYCELNAPLMSRPLTHIGASFPARSAAGAKLVWLQVRMGQCQVLRFQNPVEFTVAGPGERAVSLARNRSPDDVDLLPFPPSLPSFASKKAMSKNNLILEVLI